MYWKCEYCGSIVEGNRAKCPNCGGARPTRVGEDILYRTGISTAEEIYLNDSPIVAREAEPTEATGDIIYRTGISRGSSIT